MVIAVDPQAVLEWVHPDERELPADQRTVFLFRPLAAPEAREFMRPSESEDRVLELAWDAMRLTLIGWRNFKLANGSDASFERVTETVNGRSRQVASEKTLGYVPATYAAALMTAVMELNRLGVTERKN